MTAFVLGNGSKAKLAGISDDLRRVVERAIELTEVDFTVVEGMRSMETQSLYVARGVSKTMNSRHLTGHAVDLAPWIDSKIAWKDLESFKKIGEAMFKAADELGILIQWGADWDQDGITVDEDDDESFMDAPHYQIPWPHRVEGAREAARKRTRLRLAT